MPVRHVTLTPNVVMTVTIAGVDYDKVAVLHKSAVTDPVWASVTEVDPVAEANDTYYIPAGARRTFIRYNQTGDSHVRLLSVAAATLEVEFW